MKSKPCVKLSHILLRSSLKFWILFWVVKSAILFWVVKSAILFWVVKSVILFWVVKSAILFWIKSAILFYIDFFLCQYILVCFHCDQNSIKEQLSKKN